MIDITKLFPIILIALDICAAVVYGFNRDFWNAGYWISAALISVCVICR